MSLRSRVIAAGKKREALNRRVRFHLKAGRNPRRLIRAYRRARRDHIDLKRAYEAAKRKSIRERAYDVAASLVGVMEEGGNNMGPMVSKIIRANGGTGPEPWCGDFVAYCYRLAGSNRVQRAWASVRMLRGLAGIHATTSPRRGDLVRFTFDHVGMFVRYLPGGYIECIEGNTGASGAVSDSRTGGDGVYRKRRHASVVNDYLRVVG